MKVQQALLGGDHLRGYNKGPLGGWEAIVDDTAFPFLMTSLATLTFGAGKISLDYLVYLLWYKPKRQGQSGFPAGVAEPQDHRPTDA